MTPRLKILSLLIAAAIPAGAHAHDHRPGAEWRDDRGDARRAEALLADYDLAARSRDRQALWLLEREARGLVHRLWQEQQAELALHRRARWDDRDDGPGCDRPDVAADLRRLDRIRELAGRLDALQGRFRRWEILYKRELFNGLVELARQTHRDGRWALRQARHEPRGERRWEDERDD